MQVNFSSKLYEERSMKPGWSQPQTLLESKPCLFVLCCPGHGVASWISLREDRDVSENAEACSMGRCLVTPQLAGAS